MRPGKDEGGRRKDEGPIPDATRSVPGLSTIHHRQSGPDPLSTSLVCTIPGDCLEELRKLPTESVHCCVTSPPYWGLRDYGIPPSIWPAPVTEGGHSCPPWSPEECAHEWERHVKPAANGIVHEGGMSGETLSGNSATRKPQVSAFCAKCGAWRGCLGLEPTPELFVAHLVAVFAEVRRVLRKDGTLWVNLGDCYATGAGSGVVMGGGKQGESFGGYRGDRNGHEGKHAYKGDAPGGAWAGQHPGRMKQNGLATNSGAGYGPAQQPNRLPIPGRKPGDLVGIPWLTAFALQADGWWLRQANIWHKPACMPESVNGVRWERCRVKVKPQDKGSQRSAQIGPRSRDMSQGEYIGGAEYIDCAGCHKCEKHGGMVLRKGAWRHTTSHEYVFQFSKSADYFCDAMAAQEPVSGNTHSRGKGTHPKSANNGFKDKQNDSFKAATAGHVSARNPRSVWRVNTKPFKGAHFATFPPDLIRPVLQAACPARCCTACGAPYAPVVERTAPSLDHQKACGGDVHGQYHGTATKPFEQNGVQDASAVKARVLAGLGTKRVTGLRPTCRCSAAVTAAKAGAEPESGEATSSKPGVTLDPFFGSGTTGMVCQELGRECIGIELAAHYHPLIAQRLATPAAKKKAKRRPRSETLDTRLPDPQRQLFAA